MILTDFFSLMIYWLLILSRNHLLFEESMNLLTVCEPYEIALKAIVYSNSSNIYAIDSLAVFHEDK